jgi:dihydroorotase
MALLLKNAHCVDPAIGLSDLRDVLIRDGLIAQIGVPGAIQLIKGEEIDLAGQYLVPGLVDIHVHLRDPGQEYKEDIESGGRAAAKGGFTDILCMPNTKPTIDNATQVAYVLEKARNKSCTHVHVAGSMTVGLKGEALAEMGDMRDAGAGAFTDDGRGVQDSGIMRTAMEYAHTLGLPVLSHCQSEGLVGPGQVNEGVVSTRLGLAPWPAYGEEEQIARDIALSELTGCALHIQHITTAAGVELVRQAKQRGLSVTCEVTPHHLFLCEDDIDVSYNTSLKMNPPLRTAEDAAALRKALVEGVIDCVSTDHAPHAKHEKALEFEIAPFGTTGLETALGLVMTEMVASGQLGIDVLVQRMAHAPRKIIGLAQVNLVEGARADLTVIDSDYQWQVSEEGFESKSVNSAFIGRRLKGRASYVFVDGYASLENGKVVSK